MAKAFKIDDEVREILSSSEVGATSVKLPGEIPDRKLYDRVNKVLEEDYRHGRVHA